MRRVGINRIILDNSVNSRLICPAPDQAVNAFAVDVLKLAQRGATFGVPTIWPYEMANVCIGLERQGVVSRATVERYFTGLNQLPIFVDTESHSACNARTYALSMSYDLSIYDAAYLELALRTSAPLATNDKQLARSAKAVGVTLCIP